jgi:uncharacterized alkaline shock family protein YloU
MTTSPGKSSAAERLLVNDQLACGADVDQLLEQVADGNAEKLTSHQQHCPHCQAAIGEFTLLWAPVRELAATPVPTPADLTAAVMDRIRRLVNDVWYTLNVTDQGAIRIAARVVANLARDTARLVPGVRVALGRSTQAKLARLVEKTTLRHRHPHSAVGVLGRTAVVDLALAVQYGPPIHDIAHEVQQRVIAALQDSVGLQDVTINIHVDDVLPPPDSHQS